MFTQNGPFSPNETFLGEIINIINTYYNLRSKMSHLSQTGALLEKPLIYILCTCCPLLLC